MARIIADRIDFWATRVAKSDILQSRLLSGDEAYATGRFLEARSKYQAALETLDVLNDIIIRWPDDWPHIITLLKLRKPLPIPEKSQKLKWKQCHSDAICTIQLSLRAKLAMVSMGLQAYEDACKWADATLDTHYDRWWQSDMDEWDEYAKPDFMRAYFNKALALEKLGDIKGAVQAMEQARDCDPGDGTIYEKLAGFLEEMNREEVAMGRRRHGVVKKRRQKAARQEKLREQRASGAGFAVGVRRK